MKTFYALAMFIVVLAAKGQTLVVLGTLQDAGSPHMDCAKSCCVIERLNDYVVSLGVIDDDNTYVFEATPDFVAQTNYLRSLGAAERYSIFLTHAHMGHYAGLIHLGREAANSDRVPVYAMPRMQQFLRTNGPWNQLIRLENIVIQPLQNETPVGLSNRLKVTPLLVPHRDEYSETVGYHIQGKSKSALFIPDIDKWELWEKDIISIISSVDYAFLDATFFAEGEIPRPMAEVPHPFVVESVDMFNTLPESEKNKIYFIHLNHSNPARDVEFSKRKQLEKEGYRFANFGMQFPLD
ncbi:MAG: MBL fold metallo-hydrolase [Flavobacteriaceae bacterium]|jgi:pyrroloquinoline quinone biosynthesis protein B|nr:MBL fold metallo-hydrolase [Flavobacteriaceae bacterium]